MEYTIKMGDVREDYSLYYKEGIRELVIELKLKRSYLGKETQVTLVLNSINRWDFNTELSLHEYQRVLKRAYTYLKSKNFDIELE